MSKILSSEQLKLIWKGEAAKSDMSKYILFWFIFYIIGAFISALLYSTPYSMNTAYVSYLGSHIHNPVGDVVYNITVFIGGLALIPHFVYLYKHLRSSVRLLTWFSCFCGMLGYIGFALIGVCNQDGIFDAGHYFPATYMAFGGFGIGAVFLLPVFIRRLIKNLQGYKLWHLIVMYGQAIVLVIIALLPTTNKYFSEWLFLIMILIWLILSAVFLDNPMETQP